jgi:hypothetical protein
VLRFVFHALFFWPVIGHESVPMLNPQYTGGYGGRQSAPSEKEFHQ